MGKLKEILNTEIKIGKDKYAHLIFGFLTAVFTLSYFKDIKKTPSEKIALATGVSFGVWALKEIFDCFIPGHTADINDLFFSCAGIITAVIWTKYAKKK